MGKLFRMIFKKKNKMYDGGILHLTDDNNKNFINDITKRLKEQEQASDVILKRLTGDYALFTVSSPKNYMGEILHGSWKDLKEDTELENKMEEISEKLENRKPDLGKYR